MFFNLNTTGFNSCSDAAVEFVNALIDYGFVAKFSEITQTVAEQIVQQAKTPPSDPGLYARSVTVLGYNTTTTSLYNATTAAARAAELIPLNPPYAETEDFTLAASSGSVNVTLECPDSMAINGKKWRIKISSIGESLTQTYIPSLDYEGQSPIYSDAFLYNRATGYSTSDITTRFDPVYGFFDRYGTAKPGIGAIRFNVSYHSGYSLTVTHTYYLPAVSITIIVGTETNLPDDGSIVYDSVPATTTTASLRPTLIHPIGGLSGVNWGNFANDVIRNEAGQILYNAVNPVDVSKYFYSSYFTGANDLTKNRVKHYSCVSITDRGIFFGIWNTDSQDTGKYFSWLVMQYPVLKSSGIARGLTPDTADGLTPLFCIFSAPVDNTYFPTYGKVIVRERDISVPSKVYRPTIVRAANGSIVSVADEEDHPSFINPHKQVCFDENGNYVATFLSDLTTRKYFYPDELDMVATVSSDLVGFGQELQFTVYGEPEPRTYVALQANSPNNTGMRILVLKNNPNPPDTVPPPSE